MSGYSNNWKTSDWYHYVKSRTDNVLLVRDHSGPEQGAENDLGFDSLYEDCRYMDIVHIDPWKSVGSFDEGMAKTLEYIRFCHHINSDVFFEIGTEEAIFPYEAHQLDLFINFLKDNLASTAYKQIKYAVVQSGTSIKNTRNTGVYSEEKLTEMAAVCRKYNLLSKEHNGDYLIDEDVRSKFKAGLNAINIAPEFGQIETKVLLAAMHENDRNDLIEEFYQLCYKSQKWCKWVDDSIDPVLHKEEIIKITGHYVFSDPAFESIKRNFDDIDTIIKIEIKNKINSLLKFSTKIKAILYDLDGVLVEAIRIHYDALNMALRKVAGIEIAKEEEDDFNGIPTRKKLAKLSAQGRVKDTDHDLIWETKQNLTKDSIRKNLTPDIDKIKLHTWARSLGIKSVCVTNSITETAKLMLECSGQWEYMDLLVSNQMVNHSKPNSEPYVIAMVMLGILPEECIIVEDSDVGLTSAVNTGAHIYKVKDKSEVTEEHLQTFLDKMI
jgi:HAD superfamily hydrolase (TIGR01509 family)